MDHGSTSDAYRNVLRLQAAYYTLTGIWPIVHIDTFEAITGPKLERWVVRTLGGVITAVGASLWTAAHRSKPGPETIVLAVGSAAALGVSDAIYAIKRRISPVYLADAAVQAALITALARTAGRRAPPDAS